MKRFIFSDRLHESGRIETIDNELENTQNFMIRLVEFLIDKGMLDKANRDEIIEFLLACYSTESVEIEQR